MKIGLPAFGVITDRLPAVDDYAINYPVVGVVTTNLFCGWCFPAVDVIITRLK